MNLDFEDEADVQTQFKREKTLLILNKMQIFETCPN